MCASCEDLNRTVLMLGFLVQYAEHPRADQHFADVVGGALALSLPLDEASTLYRLPPATDPESEW
ncbi:hypothetical protein [Streptomyces sp. NPDC005485]|uniref:hypothetical protein n=1 Tax=Streptomyces sp. NPDC005485 TaxID=3155591 RepID=UPI0033B94E06